LYRECRGVPPDLIVYFGNLDWRSVGTVGLRTIHTFKNDTGPDDANHDWHGIFIMRSPQAAPKGELQDLSIFDIAPTILNQFGLEPPTDMIGKSLL
jgi:predicted AlkP superfamily phosphohydrolase/phosphomutase